MSLFPAYSGSRNAQSSPEDGEAISRSPSPVNFAIDKLGNKNSSKSSHHDMTEVVTIDSTDGDSDHEKKSSSKHKSKHSKHKHHKKKQRKRSRSRSKSPSRHHHERSSHQYNDSSSSRNSSRQQQNDYYKRPRYDDYDNSNNERGHSSRGRDRGTRDNYEDFQDNRMYNNSSRGQYERGSNYYDNNRGRGNYHDRIDRGRNQEYPKSSEGIEKQRVFVSNQPHKKFLEEVNLPPEFAFRIDTSQNKGTLEYQCQSLPLYDTPRYRSDRFNVMGITLQESKVLFPFQHRRFAQAIKPQGIDEDGNPVDEEGNLLEKSILTKPCKHLPLAPKQDISTSKSVEFLSLSKSPLNHRQVSTSTASGSTSVTPVIFKPKQKKKTIKERTEWYNTELRQHTKNCQLWIEFVQFQDVVFEENGGDLAEDDSRNSGNNNSGNNNNEGKKRKHHRKALIDKKIAILDRAVEYNPKSLELHRLRLDLLNEIYKPRYVLGEWKKLVNTQQHVAVFWTEYLRFAATQLQLYSSSLLNGIFDKCFQKFNHMLTPTYPQFQRPPKFHILLADTALGFNLMLRNSGFTERAISLSQAQLELDFYMPDEYIKRPWEKSGNCGRAGFEHYWNTGVSHFGESGFVGWSNSNDEQNKNLVSISDSSIMEFEDDFFSSLKTNQQQMDSTKIWLDIETARSKLYYLPWRSSCSDIEECDDTSRIVLGKDIFQFLVPIPTISTLTSEMCEALHFRHVVNFLCVLLEDFLPHTHTLDSLLCSLTQLAVVDSRSLFHEVNYWRKLMELYFVGGLKYSHIIPEGYKVPECTWQGETLFIVEANNDEGKEEEDKKEKENLKQRKLKQKLFKENERNYMELVRSVVEKSIDHLNPSYASILAQMYLRYEQKCTTIYEIPRNNNPDGDSTTTPMTKLMKSRIKFAKNLLKKEKLRNATGVYGELAMLEYFQGKRSKAIDLLVKTINSAGKLLRSKASEQPNLETDWELVLDLTKLYKNLAEFYLREDPKLALAVLTCLGNYFQYIEIDSLANDISANITLKAKSFFKSIWLALLDEENVVEKWGGDQCVEFLVQKSNLLVEWTTAYALFQFLLHSNEGPTRALTEAGILFEKVLKEHVPYVKGELSLSAKYDASIISRCNIREQLYIVWCRLGARALEQDPLTNAPFRSILEKALEEFPSSPPILLLLTDVENQCSVAGRLWRSMLNLIREPQSSCNHWTPLLMALCLAWRMEEIAREEQIGLDSFGLGGPTVPPDTMFYKMDAILEAAEQHAVSRNCPLIWRIHLKYLNERGMKDEKEKKRVKITFYEAMRNCPSAKAIYLDGVRYLPEMMTEISDLLAEKQLLVRLPMEELDVLLELEEEICNTKDGDEESKKTKNSQKETSSSSQKTKSSSTTITLDKQVIQLSDGELSD